MKTCNKCGKDKPDNDYHMRGGNQKRADCKECRNKYKQSERLRNKEEAIKLCGEACNMCGQSFPHYIYEFHHLDSKQKDANMANMWKASREKMLEELTKCVMLCANCHKKIHHIEKENNGQLSEIHRSIALRTLERRRATA